MAVHLTSDGTQVGVAEGTTIWEAARGVGIEIPVLCHEPRMKPVGVCRMCVVDTGGRVLTAACVRECEEGMQVNTRNERVEKNRQFYAADEIGRLDIRIAAKQHAAAIVGGLGGNMAAAAAFMEQAKQLEARKAALTA